MAFGLFIYSSTVSFLENTQTPKVQDFNSFDFYFIVFFELAALTIIYLILKKRKWKIQNLNLDFRINMVFVALVLVVIRLLFVYVVDNANLLSVWALPKPEITLSAGIFSMVLMVIVNSVFEEVILIGYLFKSLERWPVAIVILFSLLISGNNRYLALFAKDLKQIKQENKLTEFRVEFSL